MVKTAQNSFGLFLLRCELPWTAIVCQIKVKNFFDTWRKQDRKADKKKTEALNVLMHHDLWHVSCYRTVENMYATSSCTAHVAVVCVCMPECGRTRDGLAWSHVDLSNVCYCAYARIHESNSTRTNPSYIREFEGFTIFAGRKSCQCAKF